MLFGRRKGDFIKDKEIEEYPEAINLDRLNEEENLQDENIDEKIDLLDYLDSIPDEENPEELEVLEEIEPITDWELLAEFIRLRSSDANLTSRTSLEKEDQDLEALLLTLHEDEKFSDIKSIKGSEDLYYYSEQFMSDNYAMIAVLVDEKDIAKTIAKMVRWNSKTYPCPTPIYYFENSPYLLSEPQIERALYKIKNSEEYEDVCELQTGNDVRYLYSTETMSEKYARALAENVEFGEYGYR